MASQALPKGRRAAVSVVEHLIILIFCNVQSALKLGKSISNFFQQYVRWILCKGPFGKYWRLPPFVCQVRSESPKCPHLFRPQMSLMCWHTPSLIPFELIKVKAFTMAFTQTDNALNHVSNTWVRLHISPRQIILKSKLNLMWSALAEETTSVVGCYVAGRGES